MGMRQYNEYAIDKTFHRVVSMKKAGEYVIDKTKTNKIKNNVCEKRLNDVASNVVAIINKM